jgi:hypothetical protein
MAPSSEPGGKFGWAETVLKRFFERLWFLAYYENFELPSTLLKFSLKWGKTTCRNNA